MLQSQQSDRDHGHCGEVDAFMARVPDHVLVVFDEAYYELVDLGLSRYAGLHSPGQGKRHHHAHDVQGLWAGRHPTRIRGGDADGVLAPVNQAKEAFAVNSLAQAAGVAALDDQEFLQRTVESNRASRLWLYEQFERLGLFYVRSHTNFVLVEIGPRALDVQRELLKQGVIVRPCSGYDLDDFLRVTVGTPEQDARFVQVLESVLAEL